MLKKFVRALGFVLCVLLPTRVASQGLEAVGNRAAALSAFVAVADDASAVIWNPAGLAQGPFFNLSFDIGRADERTSEQLEFTGSAGRQQPMLIAVGLPPIGISYYRTATSVVQPTSPPGQPSANPQTYQASVRSMVTSHFGVTVVQSLGDYVTVGATARLVRGSFAADTATIRTWSDGFEYAESLDTHGSTKGDLDVGALVAGSHFRAGIVARNLTEPEFEAGDGRADMAVLERHVRFGVAWAAGWPGLPRTIVAFDADVTRTSHASGDRRDVAAGVERWLMAQRIGLRGGVRASTVGDARPVVSAGGSFALRTGLYVDAYLAKGTHEDHAWGIGGRVTF